MDWWWAVRRIWHNSVPAHAAGGRLSCFHTALFQLPACSAGESFRISCPKLSLCHRRTNEPHTLAAHWPNSAGGPSPTPVSAVTLLFSPHFSPFPFIFALSVKVERRRRLFAHSEPWETSRCLPLCCLPRWWVQRIWSSSERAFYAEGDTRNKQTNKQNKVQVWDMWRFFLEMSLSRTS